MWGGGVSQSLIQVQLKLCLLPAGISAEAISMTHFDMYWLDIFTFSFYEPFLFHIFVRWKFINKNLGLPLSTTAFTVNSHTDNHSYKYICFFFQILYNLKLVFFIKIHVEALSKVFHIQIWFKCETPLLYFLVGTIVYRKKFFIQKRKFFGVDSLLMNHILYTHDVTCNMRRWNRGCNDISIKNINKS